MFTEAVSLGRVVANSEKCRARFCVLIHMTLTGHYIHRRVIRIIPDGFNDLPPSDASGMAERRPRRINFVIPHLFHDDTNPVQRTEFREHQHVK
jgi:hypothetical protein